jgi:hypothetical protein
LLRKFEELPFAIEAFASGTAIFAPVNPILKPKCTPARLAGTVAKASYAPAKA